jgi:hypothetical protein
MGTDSLATIGATMDTLADSVILGNTGYYVLEMIYDPIIENATTSGDT